MDPCTGYTGVHGRSWLVQIARTSNAFTTPIIATRDIAFLISIQDVSDSDLFFTARHKCTNFTNALDSYI